MREAREGEKKPAAGFILGARTGTRRIVRARTPGYEPIVSMAQWGPREEVDPADFATGEQTEDGGSVAGLLGGSHPTRHDGLNHADGLLPD